MGYYTFEELQGARIYDSIGLYYGVLTGYRVEPDDLYLEVSIVAGSRERVIDVDELARRLRGRGHSVEGEEVEVLVSLARREGVDIPYRIAQRSISMLKALVPSSEVLVADYRRIAGEDVKAILLSTPREALFRGLEARPIRGRLPEPGRIKGRLVISRSMGVLGYVHGYVIGPGGAGIRAGSRTSGYVEWLRFLDAVKRIDQDLYKRLVEEIEPLRNPRVGLDEVERVRGLIEEAGLGELLERHIVYKRGERDTHNIPLAKVISFGDAVIVE